MSKPIEAEQKYANQSVLITGGGSGIGLAIAKRFASMGARTLIIGRSESRLKQAVNEIESVNPDGQHSICGRRCFKRNSDQGCSSKSQWYSTSHGCCS